MSRSVVAGMLAALVASVPAVTSVAHAADGHEVCILKATETITAPRKPNLFLMKLDCGAEPTMEQESLIAEVNALTNTADAVSKVISLGYEVEAATTMVSYTGNAIVTTYTMVVDGDVAPTAPSSSFEDEFDLPESDDPFPIIPDDEDEESEEDAMDSEDGDGDMLDDEVEEL